MTHPAPEPDGSVRRRGFTSKRAAFATLETMPYAEVRERLGYDLPVIPLGGRFRQCTAPDRAAWERERQEAAARNPTPDTFFLRRAAERAARAVADGPHPPPEGTPVATDADGKAVAEERSIELGRFCAEAEERLPKAHQHLPMMFHAWLTRAGLGMAPRTQYETEWAKRYPTVPLATRRD